MRTHKAACFRKGGFLPQEFATVAVPCNLLLMDLKGFLLEGKHTRNGIEDQSKKVRLILSGYRSMGNALRKGTTDMQSALNTIKTAAALRAKQAKSASDRKAAKAKVKATKLPNFAATSDPSIIKNHRSISKHMDIEKASSFETLKNCRGGDKPFILRPGPATGDPLTFANVWSIGSLGFSAGHRSWVVLFDDGEHTLVT